MVFFVPVCDVKAQVSAMERFTLGLNLIEKMGQESRRLAECLQNRPGLPLEALTARLDCLSPLADDGFGGFAGQCGKAL